MAFKDLRTFVERPTLDLPIGGKVYKIPEPDAATGAWVQKLMWIGEKAADTKDKQVIEQAWDEAEARANTAMLTDDQEQSLYRRVLGPIWDEMARDGVSLDETKHAGLTAAIWVVYGEAMAETYWTSPGQGSEGEDQGEASTPGSEGSRPASGGAESTTNRPASGSGTRAGKKKPKQARRGGRS